MPDDRPPADLHQRLGERAACAPAAGCRARRRGSRRCRGRRRSSSAPLSSRPRRLGCARAAPSAAGDLQGLRRPGPLRRADGRGGGRGDRARLRARARRAGGHAHLASCASASVATCASPRRRWPRATAQGMVAEGGARGRRRDGRHRDALLARRLARPATAASCAPPRTTPRPTPARRWSSAGRSRSPATAGSRTSAARSRAGCRAAPGGGSTEEVEIYAEFQEAALRYIDPSAVKPLRVVVDGGNGMAGPMVGPLLERLGLDLVADLLDARRQLPRPRAQPAARGEPSLHRRQGPRGGCRPGHRLGRRRRPLLLHRRHGQLRRRRLPHRAARRVAAAQGARRDDPLRRARQPRGARHRRRRRRHRARQPRRARLLQDAHARDGRDLRRRGLGPLLLPRLLQRRLGDAAGAAHPRAAVGGGRDALRRCSTASGRSTSSPGRSTPRSPTRAPRWRSSTQRYSDGEVSHLDGVSVDYEDWHFNVRPSNTEPLLRLNLESLVSVRGHGAPARRDARADPLVRAEQAGIHCLPIPTPFAVGRVNTYLIEDEPADAVDSGPNSGKALDELERALRRARPRDRGPRADRRHPPAHRPHRPGIDPRPALGRRGRGARPPRPAAWSTTARRAEDDDEFAQALMLRHGIPEDVVHALRSVSRAFRGWGASAHVTRPLRRRRRSSSSRDRTLQVLHRPGHSPSDTIFWDDDRRLLIAADHLIKHISSNPLISRPLDGDRRAHRAPASADDLPELAAQARASCPPSSCSRATASRSPTTSR